MEYIRMALKKDISRIAEMIVINYRVNFYPFFQKDEYYFGELNVLDTASKFRENSKNLKNTFVYDDGVVKGMILLNNHEINKLYVEPRFQNQGIGSKLFKFAVQEKHADFLWVLEYNKRATAFYERNGFKLTGEKIIEDDFVPLLKMEKIKT